jgi:hypothetical protein
VIGARKISASLKWGDKKTAADRGFIRKRGDYFLASAAGAAVGAAGAAAGASFLASSI